MRHADVKTDAAQSLIITILKNSTVKNEIMLMSKLSKQIQQSKPRKTFG